MKKFDSAEAILNFAIQEEDNAAAFYQAMSRRASSPRMHLVFESFAREEQGHKRKLKKLKIENLSDFVPQRITSMDADEFVVEESPDPEMTYLQALRLVMAKEVAAYRLYTKLAEATDDPGLGELLTGLAREESVHKLRFEIEYDEFQEEKGS